MNSNTNYDYKGRTALSNFNWNMSSFITQRSWSKIKTEEDIAFLKKGETK